MSQQGMTPESRLQIRRVRRDEIVLAETNGFVAVDEDLRRLLISLRKKLAHKPAEEVKHLVIKALDGLL